MTAKSPGMAKKVLPSKSKIIQLLAIPALAIALNACTSDKTDLEYLESAKKYAAQGDYKSHVIELKNALQQNPQNADARYLLALAYLSEQQGAAAQKELEKAIEFGKSQQELTDELAIAYYLQYKFEDLLSETINHQGLPADDQAKVLFYRGLANISLNRSSDAETDFSEAAKLSGTSYGKLSEAYIAAMKEDVVSANEITSALIKQTPKFTEAHLLASKIEATNKNLAKAIDHLNSAITAEPNRLQLYVDIASLQTQEKRYEDAEKSIDKVLKVAPNHLTSNLIKARLKLQQKAWEDARKFADTALAVSAVNVQAKLISGTANFYLKNYELTRDKLRGVVDKLPPEHMARRMLAYAEFQLGYNQNANAILDSLGEVSKDDNELLSGFGSELAKQGKYSEALSLYEKASELNPDNPELLTRLGMLKLRSKDSSGIEDLELALEKDSNVVWARVALAKQYVSEGKIDKAIGIADELISSEPSKVDGYMIKAEIYGSIKEYKKANDQLLIALEKNEKNIPLLFSLLKVSLALEDWEKAKKYNSDVLAIEPTNAQALINMYRFENKSGTPEKGLKQLENTVAEYKDKDELKILIAAIYAESKENDKAIETLGKIKKDSPYYWRAQSGLTSIHSASGNYESAITHAKNWAETQPKQAQSHTALSRLFLRTNNQKEALAAIIKGVEHNPNSKNLQLEKINLLLASGKQEQAKSDIAKFTAKYGSSPDIALLRGKYLALNKEYEEALKFYKTYYEMKPNTRGVISIAELYNKLNKKEQALAELKKWLDIHPEDQSARMFLANLNLSGDNSSAVNQYRQIVEKNKDNVIALNNLAWALGEAGDVTEALKYAERAFQIKPEVPAILDTFGYLLLLSGDAEQAIEKLKVAHEKSNEEPTITYHYALALKESGNHTLAKSLLKKLKEKSFPEKSDAIKVLESL